ncbi:hypothetical protein PL11201_680085 [Planktothrix sp. PCC 11201]|nr:hypothetical protein PL11201_680085 [Planktothrix sp. PCC 11201]
MVGLFYYVDRLIDSKECQALGDRNLWELKLEQQDLGRATTLTQGGM